MNPNVVLDASALLALAFQEPGGSLVRSVMRGAQISAVNYSEVFQKISARDADASAAGRVFAGLGLVIVPFDLAQAEATAGLYPVAAPYGLGIADRACLALGVQQGATVYTADKVWADLNLTGVDVKVIR